MKAIRMIRRPLRRIEGGEQFFKESVLEIDA